MSKASHSRDVCMHSPLSLSVLVRYSTTRSQGSDCGPARVEDRGCRESSPSYASFHSSSPLSLPHSPSAPPTLSTRVPKKKEEKQEKDEAVARPVHNPAMSWMSGPIDLLGSRKVRTGREGGREEGRKGGRGVGALSVSRRSRPDDLAMAQYFMCQDMYHV